MLYEKEIAEDTETVSVVENKEELIKKLKDFRWCQSKYENIKPYYIFNDMQMNDLIEKNPKNEEELLQVNGFGKVKVDKYGKDILKILSGK